MTKLDEIVGVLTKKHVYIQTHNFPDPDAIACAYGMKVLLKKRGISATICHQGKIDAYSTSKIVEVLKIDMKEFGELEEEQTLHHEDEIILVDSQKGNSNISNMKGMEVICIDHHPVMDNDLSYYRYYDIRPELGACSTIIGQYFLEEGVPFDKKTATLLSYGIRTDTANLCRGVAKQDIEMLAMLYDKTDYTLIHKLENSALYREDLRTYSRAIKNTEIYQNVSFTNIGRNCPEVLIASICDFMLALVEVEVSVVYSLRNGGIKLSVRSENPKLDAGRITKRALKGIGDGGGHAAMAGGFVPLGDHEANDLIATIKDRYLGVMHRSGVQSRIVDNED
jgi:nanoRNase/pAp phosphatase (c-di-AMP/oligoRNAs hydrolase)